MMRKSELYVIIYRRYLPIKQLIDILGPRDLPTKTLVDILPILY